jgi:hypothetical protein
MYIYVLPYKHQLVEEADYKSWWFERVATAVTVLNSMWTALLKCRLGSIYFGEGFPWVSSVPLSKLRYSTSRYGARGSVVG